MKKEFEEFIKEVKDWKTCETPGREVKYFIGNATFLKLKVERYNLGVEAAMPFSEPDRVAISIKTPNEWTKVAEFNNKTFEEVCFELASSGFTSNEAVEKYIETTKKIDTTVNRVKEAGAKALFAMADVVADAANKVKEATAPKEETDNKSDDTSESCYTDVDDEETDNIDIDDITDEDFPDEIPEEDIPEEDIPEENDEATDKKQ